MSLTKLLQLDPRKNMADAYELSRDAVTLDEWIRVRLVILAAENGSTGIRAIEALLALGAVEQDESMSKYSTPMLLESEIRAERFLESRAVSVDEQLH